MAILHMTTDVAGQIQVNPRRVKIISTDNLATVITAGYLNNQNLFGNTIYPTDVIDMYYNWNVQTNTGTYQVFTVSMALTNGVMNITLVPAVNYGNVLLPVTSGNIAAFNGTTGQIKDGLIAANKILTSTIITPDVGSNLIAFDITVGQAALATGGSVALITSAGSRQYKIRSLQLNSGGTNFSGGGGDRLGQVTDGTTVYSVIPAATMQTLVNAQWGATALPNAASASNNTSTAAGSSLVFKYSGGTTDYTAGSLVISGIAQRVA